MPTDACSGQSTPSSWFLWAKSSSLRTRCSPSLPAKMLTIHQRPQQRECRKHLLLFSGMKWSRQSFFVTYVISCSWFPVVPKHQLQLNGFIPLHLLFLPLLGKINAYKWDFSNVISTEVIKKQPLRIRRTCRPSAGVGNGPARDSHESVSQFHPEEDEIQVTNAPHCTSDVDDRHL